MWICILKQYNLAHYAAEMATLEVTHGMPFVMMFGKVFAYKQPVDLTLVGTQGAVECILPGG